MLNVLCFDGGGVRGIISAIWAAEMEAILDEPLNKRFDLIAGTSTGSLLAVALAQGIPALNIVDIYTKHAATAFPPNIVRRVASRTSRFFSGMGLSVPKYDGLGLDQMLQEIFGTVTFGSLPRSVLIPAYDVQTMSPVVLKSWKPAHKTLLAWEVARASCAAPAYLPAKQLTVEGRDLTLVDGGLVANNPSMCALAEAVKLRALDDIQLVSVGTGSTMQGLNGTSARNWGAIQWAPHILECLMDGASDIVSYQVREFLGLRFYRMQCSIQRPTMDDASEHNVQTLSRVARKHLERPEVKQLLVDVLTRLK